MAGKQLNTKILAVRIIPNADPMLLKNLDVRPGDKSLGIFTTDCDDVSYTAVDEATKKADVHVAYENDAHFYEANETGTVVYFAHCISRTGSYLSSQAGVPEGTPMAYLIAPPLEASVGLDAALKAADVELSLYYGPPTETNFAGGLLTGTQASCQAACDAFADAVCRIAEDPLAY